MDYEFYGKKEFLEDSMKMNYTEFLLHCQTILKYIRENYPVDGEAMSMYKYVSAAQWRVAKNCPNPGNATDEACRDFQKIYDAINSVPSIPSPKARH